MSTDTVNDATPTRRRGRSRVDALPPGSTPRLLRRVVVVILAGCLMFAVVSLITGSVRSAAVSDASGRLVALDADATGLYRGLANADVLATSDFVAGGEWSVQARAGYDREIERVSDGLAQAAGRLPESDPALAALARISVALPRYTALVESAQTYNRLGLPLGQSYLNNASRLMQYTMLPAAQELRDLQAAAMDVDYRRGGGFPLAVVLIGVAVLIAMLDIGRQEMRRTNRRIEPSLLAGGVLMALACLWWLVAGLIANGHLERAERLGTSTAALDDVRAAVSLARSNESLVLVAGSGAPFDTDFGDQIRAVVGPDDTSGLLADAASQVPAERIAELRSAVLEWQDAHERLRALDDAGDFRGAVDSATGIDPQGSGVAFAVVDDVLGAISERQREAFASALHSADRALTGIVVGPALLAILAAAAVAAGLGRRIGEYR
ncbi:hypothetical protein [Millisia brevis]|uniref:hypothetical protein n=1 Tax=Millisia brevis TaxID=264148 RepID=UPI00082A9B2F|nr:hypothetical protein [Millisia brevis]